MFRRLTFLDPVGTATVCCNENLQPIGGDFERYGCLKWRFRVSGSWFPVAKPETRNYEPETRNPKRKRVSLLIQ
jgi:hypothetical protein